MSRTVLAVIDMQRVFGDDGSPWQTPRFTEVLDPVRTLAEGFAGRTVFTRFLAPEEPVGAWVPYYDQWGFALQPADATLWHITPTLAPLASRQPTVDATTFSKWPGLSALVGAGDRLVLCGVSTDCCVLSTALAAADDGVEVLVVREACAGVDDESHAAALHVMDLYAPLVRVIDLATASAIASGSGGTPLNVATVPDLAEPEPGP
ncbi:MAG: cysteine hydrolase [Cellulomonadaceae bacterium]|nr:cysteine hydrolase [Cellulomonadaceae bacterium]